MEQLDGICSNLNFNNLYQAFKDKNAINLSRESEPEPAKKRGRLCNNGLGYIQWISTEKVLSHLILIDRFRCLVRLGLRHLAGQPPSPEDEQQGGHQQQRGQAYSIQGCITNIIVRI